MSLNRKDTAIIINSLSCGGAERVASILCQDVKEIKWVYKIIPKDDFFPCDRSDTKVIELGFYSGGNLLLKFLNYIYAYFRFIFLIHQHKPRVILSFLHASHIILYLSIFFNKRIERIYCERSLIDVSYVGIKKKLMVFFIKKIFSSGSMVIAISKEVIKSLKKNSVNILNYKVIYNPIDIPPINKYLDFHEPLKESDINKDEFIRLVTVSRINKIKNIEFLLQFVSDFREKYSLDIIGDGPEISNLKRISMELGIDNNVKFLGSIVNPFEIAVQSDLFVYSSNYESFGNVCMEAASYGLPVVLPKPCGALVEIFSLAKNSGSVFYESNNKMSLNKEIDKLTYNKITLNEKSKLLFNYSNKFSRRSIVNSYCEVVFK
ncbi:glycosyltransferase [Vibrio sp. 1733]|uniref:glycosyltransferase n=1 Tax=unclassified Vibrio TaxID=2614977 RepID=UPI002964E3DF|nr:MULTISPECIES: glycosyltransferase [unclassified Vibrio]MDW1889928.1 glycosyltransferase [Vibrio sp. Vb1574]MDW2185247.1 glycosyltransferase [Vibrio sp. 1733]MDW2235574.1 glycosyltransferase [Vibrio sp. 1565-1]